MTSFQDPVKCRVLVPYTPPQHPLALISAYKKKTQNLLMERSVQTQMADCRLRSAYVWSHTEPRTGEKEKFFRSSSGDFLQKSERGPCSPTVRSLILAGAIPSVEQGSGLPPSYAGTMEELLDGVREGEACTVRETVHTTINNIDYNGLQPFNKTVQQITGGIRFIETRIDSRNEEETGSTCIGMSHTLLKQLRHKHGIEGMYAVQRKAGKEAFEHATVIIECSDGYVLLDPRSHPLDRIFSIPFNQSLVLRTTTFTADTSGSQTPIFETNPDGEFEYCTNIANGDDLVTKHFMMEAPYIPPENPAFPISAYYLEGEKTGRGSRTIWVSPLQSKLTLKNSTVMQGDPEKRTDEISFQEVLEKGFHDRLESFYHGRPPTYNIGLESLHAQLVQFVQNASTVNKMFREMYQK